VTAAREEWRSLARQLADELVAAGALDLAWRAAFEAVPRHVFVPRFLRNDGSTVDSANPADRAEWLAQVYADTSLVTQQQQVPGTDLRWATSSSTMPSLMARMLRLLDVHDGHRVAEIGTGTGYNAALLCHRLGDANVASIDIDPALVRAARTALASLGWRPYLTAGDGAVGIPAAAPYDRIIATCAVPRIPPAWIGQLRADGLIVADLRGEVASSLLVTRKTGPDTVQGRFQPTPGHFMWLRAHAGNPLRDGGSYPTTVSRDGARTTLTSLDPADLEHPDLRLLLQLHAPDLQRISRTTRDGRDLLCLATSRGGWADIRTAPTRRGRRQVTYGGPDSLWRTVEATVQQWHRLGQPERHRLGLTAHTDGTHTYWLDHPDHELPTTAGKG
jgi:methyltransferase of ATP-grasp peptide maturase system